MQYTFLARSGPSSNSALSRNNELLCGVTLTQMNQFDLLISTVPKAYPMQPFVNVLKQDATLVKVGAMEELQGVTGINVSPPGHGKDRAKQRCALSLCKYPSTREGTSKCHETFTYNHCRLIIQLLRFCSSR